MHHFIHIYSQIHVFLGTNMFDFHNAFINAIKIDQSHRFGRLNVANQREVMTRLLELLYVLNIKRNIF